MSATIYTTNRGAEQTQRPQRDLNMLERRQILEDFLTEGPKATVEKWNIKRQTLEHLKWYYRDMLAELEDAHFARHGL